MRRVFPRSAILATVGLLAAGCASQPDARYVYQDGEFGVIGIPVNTPYGKKDYRTQVEDLMSRHFPDGYEVVRAEEVVEGEKVLDIQRKREYETEPTLSALNQMIKLGKLARSTSQQEKEQLPILESRIIYKRRTPGPSQGANGFAALASTTPPLYIDPNEMTRCKAHQLIADAKKLPTSGQEGDADVRKAAHTPSKEAQRTPEDPHPAAP